MLAVGGRAGRLGGWHVVGSHGALVHHGIPRTTTRTTRTSKWGTESADGCLRE